MREVSFKELREFHQYKTVYLLGQWYKFPDYQENTPLLIEQIIKSGRKLYRVVQASVPNSIVEKHDGRLRWQYRKREGMVVMKIDTKKDPVLEICEIYQASVLNRGIRVSDTFSNHPSIEVFTNKDRITPTDTLTNPHLSYPEHEALQKASSVPLVIDLIRQSRRLKDIELTTDMLFSYA